MNTVATDKKNRPISTIVSWVVTVLTLGYMLPWAIAATRGKRNSWAIFWLTLLLGWSIIGFIVALVMSLNSHNLVAVYGEDRR
jgi:predicted membrane channel-forming protein YqfA (hemolysin III family)